MKKRRKRNHPKLPNGMGSIKFLGKGRSNPYAVYPPEHRVTEKGNLVYKKALCYVPDWYTGFAVLIAYRAGTYVPGDELDLPDEIKNADLEKLEGVARKIIYDYEVVWKKQEANIVREKHKFYDAYYEYKEYRFGEFTSKKYSVRTKEVYERTFKILSPFYDQYIENITRLQFQNFINRMSLTYSRNTVQLMITVMKNVMSYGIKMGYITDDPTKGIDIPAIAAEAKHNIPYTQDELKVLWSAAHAGDKWAIMTIIQVYSGFRISAYDSMKVDLDKKTFTGGVKTGVGRTIPIHPAIYPFVYERIKRDGKLLDYNKSTTNRYITEMCDRLKIAHHSTHSARHTFKMLCDRYGVSPIASRYMMGHSLATGDVHDAYYTHFELSDLEREIRKIVV